MAGNRLRLIGLDLPRDKGMVFINPERVVCLFDNTEGEHAYTEPTTMIVFDVAEDRNRAIVKGTADDVAAAIRVMEDLGT